MTKFLYIFLFLFAPLAFAQNSDVVVTDTVITVKKNAAPKIKWTEKDLKTDRSDSIIPLHFDSKFKSKYRSSDFDYDPKLHTKNALERFWDWLVAVFKSLFNFGTTKSSEKVLGFVIKTILVLVFLFVIYLIVKAILNKEGNWIFGKNSDKKIIRYDELERNIHLVDFEKLIKETLQSGEKRLSIRYYYLWLLKRLSEREIIEWDVEKTNSDYLHEIKNEKLRENFAYLSHLYNYIWYGEFDIEDVDFEKAKTTFEKTIKTL